MGRASGAEIRPSAEPQSPCGCLGPSPSLPREQGLGGLRHKEVVVEGDAKSLKGECTSAILEGRKRREKREKERRTGRARTGAGGGGAETREGPAQNLPPQGFVKKEVPAPSPSPQMVTG